MHKLIRNNPSVAKVTITFSLTAIRYYQSLIPSSHWEESLVGTNQLAILQKLYDKEKLSPKQDLLYLAIKEGNLATTQWLYDINCPYDADIIDLTLASDNLDLVKWCHEKVRMQPLLYYNNKYFRTCITKGRLENLKWLFGIIKKDLFSFKRIWKHRILYRAAKSGHQHILSWLLEQKDKIKPIEHFSFRQKTKLFLHAVLSNSISLCQWLYEYFERKFPVTRDEFPWNDCACACAAHKNNLPLLKWLRAPTYLDHQGMWKEKRIAPWKERTFSCATHTAELKLLAYLYEQHCPWSATTFANAAARGDVTICQWLYDRGCPWDDDTAQYVISYNHLCVLQWLRAHHYPWNLQRYLSCAQAYDRPEIVAWLMAEIA